ncbi:cyclic lactone autoinducer peptide [Sinanaerobacter chloroacetimidivorans]|uniref:Cyclic lactone autoinducer peptide n=1 Tax=Sinanaerobacter chloroacetimidivorans TaxID=2818044 RepID=A0A8J8AZX2_9FIRM|nr:cyclic lactone autoinducer peptide [Sinanaerobacter chloroacetimidivorans]MBR0596634.1 cyclic lactone autoinducer peptide [Sinanaerobacter chloroacetimidivorans]
MFKKLSNLLFVSAACFLLVVADAAMSTTSLVYHGEPDCPKELLK